MMTVTVILFLFCCLTTALCSTTCWPPCPSHQWCDRVHGQCQPCDDYLCRHFYQKLACMSNCPEMYRKIVANMKKTMSSTTAIKTELPNKVEHVEEKDSTAGDTGTTVLTVFAGLFAVVASAGIGLVGYMYYKKKNNQQQPGCRHEHGYDENKDRASYV